MYRLSYHNDDDSPSGTDCFWCTSGREAHSELKRLRRDGVTPIDPYCVECIDVPLTRAALVAFLNRYASAA